ncbi:hypothetical protein Salat_2636200 [Sesamum alatum]|uniref:Uncharacterized protein n=1 Tax=Sesamum alatum TaxID=300844 RepID=A0AAE1XPL6_9LAMI|nr:hypothetical protein Salat_2636200 [Sesamum alatum]
MEKTFVDALLEQARRDNFKVRLGEPQCRATRTRPDVICNCVRHFVTATDTTWLEIVRDLLEELNTLFVLPLEDEDAPPDDESHAEEDQFVPEGPVDFGQVMEYLQQVQVPPKGADDVHEVVHIIFDTYNSTSSLWRFINEYYDTDSDADSVLSHPACLRPL